MACAVLGLWKKEKRAEAIGGKNEGSVEATEEKEVRTRGHEPSPGDMVARGGSRGNRGLSCGAMPEDQAGDREVGRLWRCYERNCMDSYDQRGFMDYEEVRLRRKCQGS